MKIRTKLTLTSAIVGSAFLVTMWIVYNQAQMVEYHRQHTQFLASQILATTNLRAVVRSEIVEAYQYMLSSKPEKTGLLEARENVHKSLDTLRMAGASSSTADGESSFDKIEATVHSFDVEIDKSVALFSSGKKELGQKRLTLATEDLFNEDLIKEINARLKVEQDAYRLVGNGLKQTISLLKITVILLFGISTLVVAFLIHQLSRSFGERLLALVEATQQVKKGDLDNFVVISGRDELNELADDFNEMVRSLSVARKTMLDQQLKIIASSKMSALGQMAGGIAHEINNPLAVIAADASNLQMLAEKRAVSRADITKVSERILRATERIAKIIKGLRTFARDGEKDPLVPTSVEKIILETLEYCYARFKSNDVDLRVTKKFPKARVECRPVQISQVLLNLLNNAFDAVNRTDEAWVSIDVRESDEWVEFLIKDSGHGIKKEVAEHILEPFFTTKKVGEGTGIGLSIASGIMKAHKGQLFVDHASPNTCFIMRLRKAHVRDLKQAA